MEPRCWEPTLLVLFGLLCQRAAVGLSGYSGEHQPPMYGDFEAQRHWMEVTVNLPPTSWYKDGPDNDLLYWGLDYPPLSAYASWCVGMIARCTCCPNLVELHSSRGIETPLTRAFMRCSVLASDVLVFLPAALAAAAAGTTDGTPRLAMLLQIAAVPALVLIDHGHFQYNGVSLGLTIWAMVAAMGGRPLISAAAFSLALNFKQMSLYLAPAFFCYLLAGCLRRRTLLDRALTVLRLGSVVIATFAVCWAPFLRHPSDAIAVLRRVFPVERHLYEDKVANLWCTLALLPPLKLKALLPISTLLRLALGATVLGIAPPCGLLLARPSRVAFVLCATSCGLAFFLCSFQVHEKHILLPLLPASLLAPRQPLLFGWLAAVATFSLYPLLVRDGLATAYAVCQLSFLALSLSLTRGLLPSLPPPAPLPRVAQLGMLLSLVSMVLLHVTQATVPPPARYPDLFSVAFAAFSCLHFVVAYAFCVCVQWRLAGVEEDHTPFDVPLHALAPRTASKLTGRQHEIKAD